MIASNSSSTIENQKTIRNRIVDRIGGPRSLRGYVRGKLAADPAYNAVLEILSPQPRPVLDVGCGLGLLAFHLRENGYPAEFTGIDPDAKKIARAQRVAETHYNDMAFRTGDARDVNPNAEATVLLDILHYLDDAEQTALFHRLAEGVNRGGIVIIRNAPRDRTLRFALTYLEEIWVRTSRWIVSGARINFPTTEEITRPFREAGCHVSVRPLWGRTPFNSYLYVFSPPAASVTDQT